MEYKLTIQEKTIPVEISSEEKNKATATIEKRGYKIKYSLISENELHLTINGKSLNVYVSGNSDNKTIMLNGKIYKIQDADNVPRSPKKKKGVDMPATVTPPMPAIVIAITVKEGDAVTKGQAVIILSAMKMETTLKAPYKGIVKKINVSESDKVMPGDILVDIDEIREEDINDADN